MGKDSLGVLVKCVNAALQKVASVQVVVGCPLEKLATSDPDQEIVIRDHTNIARLADIANSGIPLGVPVADLGGAIGRGVVRDDKFEILVTLAKDRVDGLGEEVLPVVNRKPDAQPGNCTHGQPSWRRAACKLVPRRVRVRDLHPFAWTLIDTAVWTSIAAPQALGIYGRHRRDTPPSVTASRSHTGVVASRL
jgi:hypothetical protein